MVSMADLTRIEQNWLAKGSPYCEHTRAARETGPGSGTGDMGCLDCGDSWSRRGDIAAPRGIRADTRTVEEEIRELAEAATRLKTSGRFGHSPAEEDIHRQLEMIWGALLSIAKRIDRSS